MKTKRGFSLFLTFLVTTVLFILVSSTYEISKISMDIGRSSALETIAFHAADGGLERGLGKLADSFSPFSLKYTSNLSKNRLVEVTVIGKKQASDFCLESSATIFEGKKVVSTRKLKRDHIKNIPGRTGSGIFLEAS
jgi:hypothetical protein